MSQIANYSQIKIVYEDNDFLIIDKPSGLLTHPVRSLARPTKKLEQNINTGTNSRIETSKLSGRTSPKDLGEATSNGTHPVNRQDKNASVVGWLLERYPEIAGVKDQYGASVGEWVDPVRGLARAKSASPKDLGEATSNGVDLRPGIVHRLDRETSGLLLIAKNQHSFDYLKKLFQERKIKKTYLALVYGRLKNKSGIIEMPIGKFGARQTTKTSGKHELKEKTAITEYIVLKEYSEYSLLEVRPHTGRTHQIRVHLKSIGHPVVCDPLYAGKNHTCPAELGRLFLHAQKLSFVSLSGTIIAVESDPPQVLESFLTALSPIIKD